MDKKIDKNIFVCVYMKFYIPFFSKKKKEKAQKNINSDKIFENLVGKEIKIQYDNPFFYQTHENESHTHKKLVEEDEIFHPPHEEEQYLNLIQEIISHGSYENSRNGNTYTKFGHQMRFSLKDGQMPILTTKN
jgi:hypothetical protein